LPADDAAVTDSLFEAAPSESAAPETTAFDFDWEGAGDENITSDSITELIA
jgi:hypothetical protein